MNIKNLLTVSKTHTSASYVGTAHTADAVQLIRNEVKAANVLNRMVGSTQLKLTVRNRMGAGNPAAADYAVRNSVRAADADRFDIYLAAKA